MTWTSEPPESELPTDDGILMGFRAWPTDGRRPLSHSLRLPPWGISLGASVMAIDIRWAELVMLRPVDPWPDLFVAWRHVGGISSCVFSPHSRFGEDDTRIERVVDHVRAARPHLVQEGWLKRPDLAVPIILTLVIAIIAAAQIWALSISKISASDIARPTQTGIRSNSW